MKMAPATEDPQEQPRILPKAYKPGPCTVLIGRGNKCHHHSGNIRLRKIVREEYLQAYEESARSDKSVLLLQLIRNIRRSTDDGIGFVKQDSSSGRWYEITDSATRVYVAQAFRDTLGAGSYKSSKQGKYEQRQLKKLQDYTKKGGYCPFLGYQPSSSISPPQADTSNGFSLEDAIATSRIKNQQFTAKTGGVLPQIPPHQGSIPRSFAYVGGNFVSSCFQGPTMVCESGNYGPRFAPTPDHGEQGSMSMMMRSVSSEEIYLVQQQQQQQQQWSATAIAACSFPQDSIGRNLDNILSYNQYDAKAASPHGYTSAVPSAAPFSSIAELDFPTGLEQSEPDQDLFASDLQDHHDHVLQDLEFDNLFPLGEGEVEEEEELTASSVFDRTFPSSVEEEIEGRLEHTTEKIVSVLRENCFHLQSTNGIPDEEEEQSMVPQFNSICSWAA